MIRQAIVLAAALTAAGCGTDPTTGWVVGTTFNTDYKTVAVPVVKNDTFDREVGYLLTSALIREIETRTPWRVASETEADTLLEVTVTTVDLRALSQSRLTKLDQEVAVQLTTDWTWERLDDNSTITGWDGMGTTGVFLPSNPIGEPIELGRLQAVDLMAEAIVDRMATSW
ncbi:MAG: LPS assembly lipoprotein LptE [Phycisphaerales bacterium]|jgi:hypothetical protein|nr:LPS assembly lipoprotein LptE [Phycisphaerales bacterium]